MDVLRVKQVWLSDPLKEFDITFEFTYGGKTLAGAPGYVRVEVVAFVGEAANSEPLPYTWKQFHRRRQTL